MSLHAETSMRDDTCVAVLHGRIDRDAAAALDAVHHDAAAEGATALLVDFTGVDYINSTGIALIVGLLARCRAERRGVTAVGLSDHFRHIFQITRLSDFMTIVDPARRTP